MAGPRDDVEELDVDLDGPDDPPEASPRRRAPAARVDSARRRRWRWSVAVAVVAVVVAAAVVRQAAVRDAGDQRVDPTAPAAELFPQLDGVGAAPGAGPHFPAVQAQAALGVEPGSAHLLAAAGGPLFWVAQDAEGRVCLVVRTRELPLQLDGRCATTAGAAARGVALEEGSGVAATLVPVGFDTRPLRERGYAELAGGLWLGAQTATQVLEGVVGAVDAVPVVPPQSATGDGSLPVFLTRDAATYAVVVACLRSDGAGGAGGAAGDGAVGVGVVVDGRQLREECSSSPAFRRFTGDGGPVRVDLDVPDGAVWAARVVQCEGSLRGPVCDRGGL